ncbi:hypothetical protein GCM10009415_18800 [Chitinophaga japonensis]
MVIATEKEEYMEIDKIIYSVIEGDCLNVLSEFPDNCMDMVSCDLPYGITNNLRTVKLIYLNCG